MGVIPMLDGSGVKAMRESIPTPNSGSLKKHKKIQVAKWGTHQKIFKKGSKIKKTPIQGVDIFYLKDADFL